MDNIVNYFNWSEHKGVPFVIIGLMIIVWSMRRLSKRAAETRKKLRDMRPQKKDWV